MKQELFTELMASANEALEHARGQRNLRTTVLPHPPRALSATKLRRIRDKLRMSQAVFAHHLNVSTKLVQAWESGVREPQGAALRLLEIGATHPEIVFGTQHRTRGAGKPTKAAR